MLYICDFGVVTDDKCTFVKLVHLEKRFLRRRQRSNPRPSDDPGALIADRTTDTPDGELFGATIK